MFYSQGLHEPFDYKDYLQRRLRTVFVPYLAWSFFYMAYVSVLSHNLKLFHPYAIFRTLWYGLAMYHIYFLVILLWFYLLMPLWRPLLRLMDRKPILSFTALFIVNMIFNFYSSYSWNLHSDNPFLEDASNLRLNYMVLHYLFIFMFGAFTAEHFSSVTAWLKRHGTVINGFKSCRRQVCWHRTTASCITSATTLYRPSLPFTSSARLAWSIPCRRCSFSSTGGNAGLCPMPSIKSSLG